MLTFRLYPNYQILSALIFNAIQETDELIQLDFGISHDLSKLIQSKSLGLVVVARHLAGLEDNHVSQLMARFFCFFSAESEKKS